MSELILRPRFIALDSSHLGDVARDRTSLDTERRSCAEEFQRAFDASGNVLLLTWHHIQELLSHRDAYVVAQRVEYLKSLSIVACISSACADDIVGGVIDLQAFEVRAAFDNPDRDTVAIRDLAAQEMIRVTSGKDIVRPFLEEWPILQIEFAKRQERAREIVAISRSNFANVSHLKIVDLLQEKLRAPDDIRDRFNVMHDELSRDIKARGDKRIRDAHAISASFLESVKRFGTETITSENPGLQILRANGVDLSDIDQNTTVGDVGAIAAFRSKLSIINEVTQLPWPELLARVGESRLPSQIIQSCVDKYRPVSNEWKGSDLTDTYLCSLAPYVDATYVDKRTHEAFRRAKQKVPEFAALVRSVEKAGLYADITHKPVGRNRSIAPL